MTQPAGTDAPLAAAAGRTHVPTAEPAPAQRDAPARSALHTRLPAPLTRLIGRERELTAVQALLAEHRLVTLTGPGGSGKTRLSLAVATACAERFADGASFVALASLQDPALVTNAIATALEVFEAPGRPLLESLVAFLQPRQLLLVLDNCEHLLAGMPVVGELLQRCPDLTVLATSRAPLHLSGERQYPVPPLPVPDSDQAAIAMQAGNAALALFCERVQAVRPDFRLTEEIADAVVEICRRLDGLPLALELAAARCSLFTPQALLARLERRLPLLTGGPRDAPARQQTLRDTIAWSYDLLSSAEQTLFCRLAVFAGGCTLEAAEAVCNPNRQLDVLAGLAALVDQHLLVQSVGGDGEPRFGMLETIREFALERLEASGEADGVRGRHAAYLLELAQQAHFDTFVPVVHESGLARLAAERDNLRAALAWCLRGAGERGIGVRLGASLAAFWVQHGDLNEGHGWLDQALTIAEVPLAERASLLLATSWLVCYRTDFRVAQDLAEGALALWRELEGHRGIAQALMVLGGALMFQGQLDAGRATFEESVAMWRRLGGGIGLAVALDGVCNTSLAQADLPALQAAAEERLAVARAVPHRHSIASALRSLGQLAFEQHNTARARPLLEECLTLMHELADRQSVGVTLLDLTQVALVEGDTARAIERGEEALALFRVLGTVIAEAAAHEGLGHTYRLAGDGRAAAARYAESLKLYLAGHSEVYSLYPLAGLAWTAFWLGRPAQATRLLAAARALPPRRPVILNAGSYAAYQADIATARAALGHEAFAAAWAAGETLSLEQASASAVALAEEIAALPPEADVAAATSGPAGRFPDGLTAREVEVLRLIATGQSTREIAAALVIAEATVTRHVTNLYGKIGARGRADATAYAFRHRLVADDSLTA